MASIEHLINEDQFMETGGSLNRTATMGFGSVQGLLDYLVGKRVLDLGSGAGIFAKQAYRKLRDGTTIISLNPRLAWEHFREDHLEVGKINGFHIRGEGEKPNLATELYLRTAVAAEWHHLPFRKESFDAVLAVGSFIFYRDTYSDEVLDSLIHLIRKNTGELRIQASLAQDSDFQDSDLERALCYAASKGCSVESGSDIDEYGYRRYFAKIMRGER